MEEAPVLPGSDAAIRRGILAIVAAMALLPVYAAAQSDDPDGAAAGIRNRAPGFEMMPGGPGRRIILKPEMISRLGIETVALRDGGPRAVPSGAVFYDSKGAAWIYVSRKPGVFAGQRVRVDSVTDGQAFLSDGPDAGTAVVTVGAAALNGTGVFGRR